MKAIKGMRWKAIPKFQGYEVSDRGEIRTYWGSGGKFYDKPRLVMKLRKDMNGYLILFLRRNGKSFYKKVSHLVAEAFLGRKPTGYCVCHNDGNRLNNDVLNLRYDTAEGNQQDRNKHGTFLGELTHQYDKWDNWIATYRSAEEASRQTKINRGNIFSVLAKRRETAGGYKWRYER